jgi:hypothetical protein
LLFRRLICPTTSPSPTLSSFDSLDARLPFNLPQPSLIPSTTSSFAQSFTMRLSYFLIAPVLALSASAQILSRDFAIDGCVGLTSFLGVTPAIVGTAQTGLYATESSCAVSPSAFHIATNESLITSLESMSKPGLLLRLLPWYPCYGHSSLCLFQHRP